MRKPHWVFLRTNGKKMKTNKKIFLTETQFKNLLSHEVKKIAYVPLRKNERNIFKMPLSEGLYKTYDIDFVVKHFCGYLNFTKDWDSFANNPDGYNGFITKVAGENDEEYVEFVSIDDPAFLQKADDAMKLCGFYKAFCEEYCNGYVQAGYEKRYDADIELNTNKLYHITKRENLPRIRKYGLVPKHKDKQTHHLDRIYFFKTDYGYNGFKKIAEDLYNNKSSFGYAVLEIEVDKIDGDIVFHSDLNTEGGVYTTDNIPPDALKIKYEYK